MERSSEYPELPSNEQIEANTVVLGGEVHILGLSPSQAQALLDFAKDHGVSGSGADQFTIGSLTEYEVERLRKEGRNIPDGAVTVCLGQTQNCHEALFAQLGIQ